METYSQVLVDGSEILELIPHRAPFVMVDKLLHTDDVKTISAFTIRPDNIFSFNGFLAEPALVENIAQTAALRIGYAIYQERLQGNGSNITVGFIGAVTDLLVHELPAVGTEIISIVKFEKEVMDIVLISGKATQNGRTLAECEMKIFIKRN